MTATSVNGSVKTYLGRVPQINAWLPRQEQKHSARVEEGTEGSTARLWHYAWYMSDGGVIGSPNALASDAQKQGTKPHKYSRECTGDSQCWEP